MAGKTAGMDTFANVFGIGLTESAANTLTYRRLETGFSLADKIAWVIHRLEYYLAFSRAVVFNTTGDEMVMGVCLSNVFSTMASAVVYTDPAVVDWLHLRREDYGVAASGEVVYEPYVKDFTNLPGGGLIVPPVPVFGFIQGTGCASAGVSVIKGFYTVRELSTDDYWQLVESRRVIT
jgi:hypothetical protein